MRALVTGGAGFIGSHLVELLLDKRMEVIVIDNLAGGFLKNFRSFEDNPLLKFYLKDIRDKKSIEPLFESVDWVFHLAALADIVPSIEKPRDYFEVNVDGTFNVLECAQTANIKRFVYSASSSCYGIAQEYPTPESAKINPQYPYALTKYLGEQLVLHWAQVYKFPALSLRLFNVYGPRARTTGVYGAMFGVFLAQKLKQIPFTIVGDGTQTRDFTFVKDVASAFYTAAQSNLMGEIFNVGSGGHYSVNRVIEILGGEVVYIPERPGEPNCTFADVNKIHKCLGWEAQTSLEEGVAILLESLNDFQDAPVWNPETIAKATEKWFLYLSQKKAQCS